MTLVPGDCWDLATGLVLLGLLLSVAVRSQGRRIGQCTALAVTGLSLLAAVPATIDPHHGLLPSAASTGQTPKDSANAAPLPAEVTAVAEVADVESHSQGTVRAERLLWREWQAGLLIAAVACLCGMVIGELPPSVPLASPFLLGLLGGVIEVLRGDRLEPGLLATLSTTVVLLAWIEWGPGVAAAGSEDRDSDFDRAAEPTVRDAGAGRAGEPSAGEVFGQFRFSSSGAMEWSSMVPLTGLLGRVAPAVTRGTWLRWAVGDLCLSAGVIGQQALAVVRAAPSELSGSAEAQLFANQQWWCVGLMLMGVLSRCGIWPLSSGWEWTARRANAVVVVATGLVLWPLGWHWCHELGRLGGLEPSVVGLPAEPSGGDRATGPIGFFWLLLVSLGLTLWSGMACTAEREQRFWIGSAAWQLLLIGLWWVATGPIAISNSEAVLAGATWLLTGSLLVLLGGITAFWLAADAEASVASHARSTASLPFGDPLLARTSAAPAAANRPTAAARFEASAIAVGWALWWTWGMVLIVLFARVTAPVTEPRFLASLWSATFGPFVLQLGPIGGLVGGVVWWTLPVWAAIVVTRWQVQQQTGLARGIGRSWRWWLPVVLLGLGVIGGGLSWLGELRGREAGTTVAIAAALTGSLWLVGSLIGRALPEPVQPRRPFELWQPESQHSPPRLSGAGLWGSMTLPRWIEQGVALCERIGRRRGAVPQVLTASVSLSLRALAQLARFADWFVFDSLLMGLVRKLPTLGTRGEGEPVRVPSVGTSLEHGEAAAGAARSLAEESRLAWSAAIAAMAVVMTILWLARR